jgi:hypothetical protein
MKKKIFTIIAFALALIFWFFDSSVHYFLYKEPQFELIPAEFNELWMRTIIVLLVIFFGIFADYFTNSIMYREKQLEVVHVYNGVLNTSGHVLNNLLNQMQLFKLEALKSKDFDREVIKYYDNAIKEASNLIDTLSRVEDITAGDLAASPT